MLNMPRRQFNFLIGCLVFLLGFLIDMGLQALLRPYARDGIYFQAWSSEDMMQTVSLRDLRLAPVESLLNIHIAPPGFDLLRALLAQLWPASDLQSLLRRVDSSLYVLWAVLLGLLGGVIFLWLSHRTHPVLAGLSALVFVLHPASIFFATFLDTTLPTSVLVLAAYYMLWRMRGGMTASLAVFCLLGLALFFTRSIFQLPFLILLAICACLLGAARRWWAVFILVTGLVGGIYTLKQWLQFGIPTTSSLAAVNLSNSVGAGLSTRNYAAYLQDPRNLKVTDGNRADVLVSTTKLDGQPNFNNLNYLTLDQTLYRRFEDRVLHATPGALLSSYAENLAIYFEPSSWYSSDNVIVDRLPWRSLYDRVFSAPVLPVLLVAGTAFWLVQIIRGTLYSKGLGVALPAAFIFLASVLLDKGENMRFKYFLEPLMFVFIISQVSCAYGLWSKRRNSAP